MDYERHYEQYRAAVEDYLSALFAGSAPYDRLYDAMRYSVLSGGKRIRPVLTLEFARLGGIDWHLALPYACALELVHNYSLIHDDLPCMDDDDLRRGKPTNHKVYGETLSILAGDALQPEAFRLIAQATGLPAESRIAAVEVLANAAGADGMVAGQVLDTLCDVRDEAGLTQLDRLKTCAMISAAAELGCVAAGMDAEKRRQAREFGDGLGLAFQLRDDILDVTGAQEVFGKPIGSDKAEGKVTFVDLLGVDGCQREVEAQTKRAKAAVAGWADSDFLRELADRMVLDGVNSNLATAVRTVVVVLMAWGMVFLTNAQGGIGDISRKSWLFLILSGLATGASWLCYYKALQMGEASKVVPIDKLSVVITLVLAFVFLREQFTVKSLIGCVLITIGTLVMVL